MFKRITSDPSQTNFLGFYKFFLYIFPSWFLKRIVQLVIVGLCFLQPFALFIRMRMLANDCLTCGLTVSQLYAYQYSHHLQVDIYVTYSTHQHAYKVGQIRKMRHRVLQIVPCLQKEDNSHILNTCYSLYFMTMWHNIHMCSFVSIYYIYMY